MDVVLGSEFKMWVGRASVGQLVTLGSAGEGVEDRMLGGKSRKR